MNMAALQIGDKVIYRYNPRNGVPAVVTHIQGQRVIIRAVRPRVRKLVIDQRTVKPDQLVFRRQTIPGLDDALSA